MRYLRSTIVPHDDAVFSFIEAVSEELVREIYSRAQVASTASRQPFGGSRGTEGGTMRLLRSTLVSLSIVAASAWMAFAAPSAAAAATPAGTVVMSGLATRAD